MARHFTATFEGETFKRSSQSKVYTHATIYDGMNWRTGAPQRYASWHTRRDLAGRPERHSQKAPLAVVEAQLVRETQSTGAAGKLRAAKGRLTKANRDLQALWDTRRALRAGQLEPSRRGVMLWTYPSTEKVPHDVYAVGRTGRAYHRAGQELAAQIRAGIADQLGWVQRARRDAKADVAQLTAEGA